MSMYANIGGANKLLAHTAAEMNSAGGGITHTTISSSITLTGGSLYLFVIGNITSTDTSYLSSDSSYYAGCIGLYSSANNSVISIIAGPPGAVNYTEKQKLSAGIDYYYSASGEVGGTHSYYESNAYRKKNVTLGNFSNSTFTPILNKSSGYFKTFDFAYVVLK